MTSEDDLADLAADVAIQKCLRIEAPRSFFLYAGAGSGKTRSLVDAIKKACDSYGHSLRLSGRKIGVITYTNAASEEIKQRLEYDARIVVSTIHAFAWSLVGGYDRDIRHWVAERLRQDIAELEEAQAKGRKGSKAALERLQSIEAKRRRLSGINAIRRFVYSPTGDNRTRDSLGHAEVIAMTAEFIRNKAGMRALLTSQFPVLLIDESQDTTRPIMEALLDLEAEFSGRFCLGLFGDMMQRIYADGVVGLPRAIPQTWARPEKSMNHRCPRRIVDLINNIRKEEDGVVQKPRSDAPQGFVRLFIVPQSVSDKYAVEKLACERMARETKDAGWAGNDSSVKTLALEHLMSARRFGFERFFGPLYRVERIRTGILEGSAPGIGILTREILPLVEALRAGDRFRVAALMKKSSPLLEQRPFETTSSRQGGMLRNANAVCLGLLKLISAHQPPTCGDVLAYVSRTRLFSIPDALKPVLAAAAAAAAAAASDAVPAPDVEVLDTALGAPEAEAVREAQDMPSPTEDERGDEELRAWAEALEAPLEEVVRYDAYVRGLSQFDTHQGVKGLEFPRVMVVISEEEARGFMFNYDKLFGLVEKSKTDLENEAAGRDTTISRTRRLFYVTCSRAEKSLAIVYYASDPEVARDAVIRKKWFLSDEIEVLRDS